MADVGTDQHTPGHNGAHRVMRYASVKLDSSRRRRSEDGALIVPGRLARTGIQQYNHGDGTVLHEYRPPDEVFDGEAVASFDGLTATDLHPDAGMVTPDTFRNLSRGHIQNPRQDGDWLTVDFYIKDGELISLIESGERTELSAGYLATLDMTPGTTPSGERYDAVQRGIRGNHAAVLPSGHARAGRQARLLDSNNNEIIYMPQEGQEMKRMSDIKITIDGIAYTLQGDDTAKQALDRLVATAAANVAAVEAATARADEAEQKASQLEADLAKATDPARIDAMTRARAELVDSARRVAQKKDLDVTGSDRDIMLRALDASGVPKLDDKSDDYVRARFDARLEALKADAEKPKVSDFANAVDKHAATGSRQRFQGLADARARALGGE